MPATLTSSSSKRSVFASLERAAAQDRIVFLVGLPGVGKSLFVKQLVRFASQAGRNVHLMLWDTCRAPFETAPILERYPEVEGSTHPAIRLATGLWAREAIVGWDKRTIGSRDILIGELPVVGSRFVELLQECKDEAETILVRDDTSFLIPVPSEDVRARIEVIRSATIAAPRHEKERRDAPVNVVQDLWRDTHAAALQLSLTGTPLQSNAPYIASIYREMFRHITRHRRANVLTVNFVLEAAGSAYELDGPVQDVLADSAAVQRIFERIEKDFTQDQIMANAQRWHHV